MMREWFKSPLFWGCLSTLLIVAIGVVAAFQPACFVTGSGVISCPDKWKYLLTATPNELGDTLAGFAGALAFVWIIVTVLLQARELSEHREVLKLQKREMEEQRKATEDMAKAMSVQAGIFEDEKKQRDERRTSELFEQKVVNLEFLIEQAAEWWIGVEIDSRRNLSQRVREESTKRITKNWNPLSSFVTENYPEDFRYRVFDFIGQLEYFDNGMNPKVIETIPTDNFESLVDKLVEILELKSKLSEDQVEKLEGMAISEFFRACNIFSKMPVWHEIEVKQ